MRCAESRCRRLKRWEKGDVGEVQPMHEGGRVGQARLAHRLEKYVHVYAAGRGWWYED